MQQQVEIIMPALLFGLKKSDRLFPVNKQIIGVFIFIIDVIAISKSTNFKESCFVFLAASSIPIL